MSNTYSDGLVEVILFESVGHESEGGEGVAGGGGVESKHFRRLLVLLQIIGCTSYGVWWVVIEHIRLSNWCCEHCGNQFSMIVLNVTHVYNDNIGANLKLRVSIKDPQLYTVFGWWGANCYRTPGYEQHNVGSPSAHIAGTSSPPRGWCLQSWVADRTCGKPHSSYSRWACPLHCLWASRADRCHSPAETTVAVH